MSQEARASIMEHFEEMPDPREATKIEHKLIDIITVTLCAVICGADGWVEVETYGKAKYEWLKGFLELPNGIPSHDTFGRVFGMLDPEAFQSYFLSWVKTVAKVTQGEVIAIDGKKLRRSYDKRLGKNAIHMVSAWATGNHLTLGQVAVEDKSNEITAIPKLLKVLELNGCIVTIDAMGCQKAITRQIIEQKADYNIALKKNQGTLYEDVADLFTYAQEVDFAHMTSDYHKTTDKGHGRIDIRECWTLSNLEAFPHLRNLSKWEGLKTIVMIRRERRIEGKTSIDDKYYISSLPNDAARLLETTRRHWETENSQHWVLDVAFREDDARVRQGHAAENLGILRRVALNLLKQEKTAKCGIKIKRSKAGWDESYLLKVLLG